MTTRLSYRPDAFDECVVRHSAIREHAQLFHVVETTIIVTLNAIDPFK
jgi:hypothetical protein